MNDRYILHINENKYSKNIAIVKEPGYALCKLSIEHDDLKTGYVSGLSVFNEMRKQGLATNILSYTENLAKQLGVTNLKLWVDSTSWVRNWYIKLGYEFTGITEENFELLNKKIL